MSEFTRISIPFSNTNNFDKLIIDYLNGDQFLKKLYSFEDNLEGIKNRIDSYKNKRLNRQILVEVLLNQYKSYGIGDLPELIEKNILSLQNPNTFTVTTAHQLNIFGGPLYIIFKLVSAISLAQKLNENFPENHFVPVYLMATEDHDIKEISSFNLFGKNYQWESDWKGIADKMPLKGIESIINELKIVFGTNPFADELISLMTDSYLNSSSLSEATAKLFNQLLGKYGLVIVNGNNSHLKKLMTDIFADELLNKTSSTLIKKTTDALEIKYYSQAKPREINLFYIGENYRERIILENNSYHIINTDLTFSKDQILEELSNHPDRFSPNVVMRPLYQETILPNVAFVGGPSEISYWLELKELFDVYDVPMPVLFLRGSAMIIDKNISNKLAKLSIKSTDTFLPVDDIIKTFIHSKEKDQPTFQDTFTTISSEFSKLSQAVSQVDPTLKAAVEAEGLKVSNSLKILEDKINRSHKKKNETEVNQIRKIKEKLFPSGKLQERDDTFISFYVNLGDSFIEMLKENLNPLEKKFIILEES